MKRTALYEQQRAAGAEFVESAGYEIAKSFGDSAAEYRAIREAAAVIDLSHRGRIEFVGPDRITFLQSICSNDVKAVEPGGGLEAAFLTTMGKVVAYGRCYVTPEAVLLDTDGDAQDKVVNYLDKYIRLSHAEMRDLRLSYGQLTVQGPRARAVVESVTGASLEGLTALRHVRREFGGHGLLIARVSHTGEEGYDLFIAAEALASLWERLVEAGRAFDARPAGFDALNTARLEAGIPLFGVDYGENHILVEANLASAVSYTKGCYVGQEIIARLHYRGHVAKRLCLLQLDAETRPIAGDKVLRDTKEVGQVTSAIHSPLLGRPLAFAMVKYEPSQVGTQLSINSADFSLPATVIDPPRKKSDE